MWLGLAAVGVTVPILIHLLKRTRKIPWGAMILLQRTQKKRKRKVRIEDLLVLILRCLALFLIAMALLRPTLRNMAGFSLIGDQRIATIIAIDGSYSMAHGDRFTRFQEAKTQAQSILMTLSPGDPVSIVIMGDKPKVVLPPTAFDHNQVQQILKNAEVRGEGLNIENNLKVIKQMIDDIKSPIREVYIITDAQKIDFQTLSEEAQGLMSSMNNEDENRRLTVIQIQPDHNENLALTNLVFAGGTIRRNATAQFVAELYNGGDQEQKRIPITLDLDGQSIDTQVVQSLKAGEKQLVTFNVSFRNAGPHRLSAHIETEDALELDNRRYFAIDVPDSINILCIDGSYAGTKKHQSETYFLEKALRLKGSGPAIGLQIEVIDARAADARKMKADFIIMANVSGLQPSTLKKIKDSVYKGSCLIIFPGSKTEGALKASFPEPDFLPAEYVENVTLPASNAVSMNVSDRGHAIGMVLQRLPKDLLNSSSFWTYGKLKVRKNVRTPLKFSNGDPLLVERKYGHGRIMIFASSANREWNDLPLSPLNPIWLHSLISYHTSSLGQASYTVGQPLHMSMSKRKIGTLSSVKTPDGQTVRPKKTVHPTMPDELANLDFGYAEKPGFYDLLLMDGEAPKLLCANIPAREANLRTVPEDELMGTLAKTGTALIKAGPGLVEQIKENRVGYEIWRALLIMALLCLIAQAILADIYSKRLIEGRKKQVNV